MAEASEQTSLKAEEKEEAQRRSGPESLVLYQAVVLKGEHELGRPATSLFWSGLAAGIAVSNSLVAEGALHEYLPNATWRVLVTGFGYSVGFLIVILGRLQLFTEHTVVAVMPAIASPPLSNVQKLARLWGIVFLTNQLGALLAAFSCVVLHLTSPGLTAAMVDVSRKMLERGMLDTMMQGIPAGFMIAAIAWLIIATKEGHFWLVTLLTYVIAIGGFAHCIASAAGAYILALTGNAPMFWPIYGFVLPALVGNIVGGTGLFALFTFAQIKEEI
ncbi:MAG TPA: formate/nitrite transporter family protein [Sphingomicrobium sp.]|nr:formate/nitrite transporter family protein [Sphingomicrobium sp.]